MTRSRLSLVVSITVLAIATALSGRPALSAQTGTVGAGGKAVAHHAGGVPENDPLIIAAGPEAQLFRTGNDAAEPTLGLTSNGDIYYFASPTNTDIQIVKSTDQGSTWNNVAPVVLGPVRRHMVDLDPYLYVDRDTDRLFFADLYVACSEMSWTDDGGTNWLTNPVACGIPNNDHETIFSGKPVTSTTIGYPKVVYYCFQNLLQALCSKSIDGGLTFLPATAPAYDGVVASSCDVITGHGAAGPDGTIYLPKADFCGLPSLAISHDEGASWNVATVSPTMTGAPDHEAAVAVDEVGNIYYAWVAKDRLPYLATSTDGGTTWSTPLQVGPPGLNEANMPSIDVGAPGKVAIAYYGTKSSPGAPFNPNGYAGTTWNGYMTMTDDALGADPLFYTGSVNDPAEPLVRQRCGPGRCGLVFDFIDIVVGPDGTPWSAFVDTCVPGCSGAAGIAGHLAGGPSLR